MSLLHNALHLPSVAARDAQTRRAWQQQQQGNAVATAATAVQGYLIATKGRYTVSLFGVCTCSGILAAVCCLGTTSIMLNIPVVHV